MKRTVLVTGAGKRLGAAISSHLAEQGWSVVLHYHKSNEAADRLAIQLKAHFPEQDFQTLRCDLSQMQEVGELFDHPSIRDLELSALINNASVFVSGRLDETSSGFLKEQMDVNFVAPLLLMQAFKRRYRSGEIVNLLDSAIAHHQETHAAYLLAKKGLEALTRMAALAWAPSIRVNGVAPGPVLPPPGEGVEYLKKIIHQIPLKRKIEPDEVARAVSFLLNNSSITGQVIFCDGGAHLM